jgi:diguanylate cyclase (GGDEF)-like protein
MQRGARDAVPLYSTERLQSVLLRELRTFRLERALNNTLQSARDYRRQLETVLERSNDAIAQVQEGIVVDANDSWLQVYATKERSVVVGQPLMDLFDATSQLALKGALAAAAQGRWTDHSLKATATLPDGQTLALDLVLSPGQFDGEPSVRLIVPARKRDEKQLARDLADAVKRDPSTGFLHRPALLKDVAERVAQPLPGGVRFIAQIRLDRFPSVEQDVGIGASEQVLIEFAQLLQTHLSPKDIAGRFGGVSFVVLLERGNERDIEAWAAQLVEHTAKNVFHVGSKTISATCTVGLGVVPSNNANADGVIDDAIEACRRGRQRGGGQVLFIDRADADTRVQAYDQIWVKHIKSALLENRFRLVQQPVASLQGDDPHMFDVLVRMVDSQGKEVLPSDFMPAAERNDLLKNIDRWVIGASLAFAAQRKPGCLFVRLSKDSLIDPTLPDWLDGQLKASKVQPNRICFQAPEDLAASHQHQISALVKAFKQRGLRFALERFGSGRDPQALIANLPLDFIKIDGALVQSLAGNFEVQQKVRALVEAAAKRKIETIAERVEDANTMAVLWQIGVQFVQGYFINEPEEVVLRAER